MDTINMLCHLPGVKKGFVKGEAPRLLKTNSSKGIFEDNIKEFKTQLYWEDT